jgi:hypothetical protein
MAITRAGRRADPGTDLAPNGPDERDDGVPRRLGRVVAKLTGQRRTNDLVVRMSGEIPPAAGDLRPERAFGREPQRAAGIEDGVLERRR